ncbi:LysR family transcriptional regulator [Luteimonas gilva]|uniref:LysR family transcriptional regulator n=1 Tax=Luteimonas gilva TaxID=2572684 RepID=A0A4U5JP29_9GAMM|nr:LysR family transcriptional regulator [Luteimonas gilva]TKR30311.1 LysR family transcriptional regulator [Luteimonas gilva]
MLRDLLPHLPVVLAVARRNGFAAAAAELGMSPSAVSHAVRAVELRLGTPLFARTTRSVALTEAGTALLGAIAPAMRDIEDALERQGSAAGRIGGVLRINAPRIALPLAITPILAALARRHPELVVEVIADDALTDIVAAGFDAGVRLGEMIAQDMVAVRLTPPFRTALVASPEYLAARGEPKTIAELSQHNCIGYRLLASGAAYAWELREGGKDVAVDVAGSARVTDALHARELALAGIGIAYLFVPLAAAELDAGRLREVLPAHAIEEPGLFLYFPRRAAEAPKLRAFIEAVRDILP